MSQNVQITTSLPSNNVTRTQLIDSIESIIPRSTFTDDDTLGVSSQKLVAKPVIPRWVKVTKDYSLWSTAALTNTINLYTLAAGSIVHSVKVKHSAAFTGGAISACTLGVGITGSATKYISAFDVFQAPGATVLTIGPSTPTAENHTSSVAITALLTSTSANLSALTAGTVDIWILYSTAV